MQIWSMRCILYSQARFAGTRLSKLARNVIADTMMKSARISAVILDRCPRWTKSRMTRRKAAIESTEHNAGMYSRADTHLPLFWPNMTLADRSNHHTSYARVIFSPSQGPCCSSDTCQFVPLSHKVQCKAESDCSYNSTCNGRSSECPSPLPRANKTRCNEGTQVIALCYLWYRRDLMAPRHTFHQRVIYSCASMGSVPDPFVWSGIWQSAF